MATGYLITLIIVALTICICTPILMSIIKSGIDEFVDWLVIVFFAVIDVGSMILFVGMLWIQNDPTQVTIREPDNTVLVDTIVPYKSLDHGNCFNFANTNVTYCGYSILINYKPEINSVK